MIVSDRYEECAENLAEQFRAGSFNIFDDEKEILREFVDNFYDSIEKNGYVSLDEFTKFVDFMALIKDVDSDPVENLAMYVFMRSASIRNRLEKGKERLANGDLRRAQNERVPQKSE